MSQKKKKKIHHEAPRYNLKLQSSKKTKSPPISIHMYSPFLWRIAEGKSRLIIKRRWWRRSLNARQIRSQCLKLHEHIHQKLTMSRLNSHDSIQHTLNARITWSRRWRINCGSRINKLLSCKVTWRRRMGCNTWGKLYMKAFRASFHLSCSLPKDGGTYRRYNVYELRRRKIL